MFGFSQKLEAILPDLWRYAYSLTRDRDRADDLVQDCVERALRKRSLWQSSRALKPWAMKILLNIYRTDCQVAGRRSFVPLDDASGPALQVAPNAEARLELSQVSARIDRLPADQRDALLLVVLGGVSYAEAAEILDIPQGTLMSRISRARKRLSEDTERSVPAPHLRSVP